MRSCLRTIVCGVVALSLLIGAFGSVARVLPVHAGIGDTGVFDTETLSTNPKPRTGKITASVVDNQPPSVPILVSPENNALLSTNIFPFVWKESTDDRGVVKYQLYLDGNLLFDNISTSNSSTADYTHTSSGGVSSLTPKHALADGLHTWKIVAYDQVGNNASSTTWSFTIDTTAPVIVIKMIGDLVVSISSQDTSTIPTHPLILYANNPVISGTTEANAKVQLSFTPPGGSLTTLNTVAAANGSFSFTMPTLPRNVVILLTFVAQDAAGNTSSIDQVPIEIKTKTIIVPPPFNEIIPPIPVPQPAEIIQPVQQIIEKVIPPVVADTVSPIANSLIGLLIPLLRLAIALHFTGVGITLITVQLLRKAARALYLLPPQERMGLVYDVETHKGVPYALVKIFPVKDEDHLHVELPHEVKQFVTDGDGLYGPVSLPPGQYTLEVTHADYTYVAHDATSRNLDDETLYNGEIFVTDDTHRHVYFMVPMKYIKHTNEARQENQQFLGYAVRRLAVSFARLPTWLLIGATLLMGVIAFFYFTVWNVVMFLLYLYTLSKRAAKKVRLPTLVGGVVDEFGDPLSLAYLRVMPKQNDHVRGVSAQADELGRFSFALNPGLYQLQASWFDGTSTDWLEIELKKQATAIALNVHTGKSLGAGSTDSAASVNSSSQGPIPATLQANS